MRTTGWKPVGFSSALKGSKKKTVLRTIRITRELDEALQSDARGEQVSLNTLLSQILTKHVEFDRFAQKYRLITLSREVFSAILDSTDDGMLEKAIQEVRNYLPKDIISFRSIRANVESFT